MHVTMHLVNANDFSLIVDAEQRRVVSSGKIHRLVDAILKNESLVGAPEHPIGPHDGGLVVDAEGDR